MLLKDSKAWDERFGLPLFPGLNNPWIYMAYATRLLGFISIDQVALDNYIRQCEIQPGIFTRWPNRQGYFTSHDEIMGICYMSPQAADRVLSYLERHDGDYNWEGVSEGPTGEAFNVFRMPWLAPYLRARAGWRVSAISQAIFALHLIFDALTRKRDDIGGALRNWLMLVVMDQFTLCRIAGQFWKARVKKVMPSLKECLAIEPGTLDQFCEIDW